MALVSKRPSYILEMPVFILNLNNKKLYSLIVKKVANTTSKQELISSKLPLFSNEFSQSCLFEK